jgi:transcriptional regulator with XRE-family HTH domain
MASSKRKSQNLVKIARLRFAEYLRAKRLEAKLSQNAVAKKLKLKNAQFISNIERGLAPVPFQSLRILMSLYSISFEELAEKYLTLQESVLMAELSVDLRKAS